ncbi:hypothetical protein EDB85DRAFT_2000270 [Lactarius pseudohatsudake]|nr:hypothetical protein EDB85DRAFT_2000270 [Lactarius pseudohatsudake]
MEFSSLCVPIFLLLHTDSSLTDRFILRCCRLVDLSNPQDTSNFYLANIYQTLADPRRPSPTLLPLPHFLRQIMQSG